VHEKTQLIERLKHDELKDMNFTIDLNPLTAEYI
jgi:hypothetical protein